MHMHSAQRHVAMGCRYWLIRLRMGMAGYVPAYHTGTLTTAYLHSIKGQIKSEKLEQFRGA